MTDTFPPADEAANVTAAPEAVNDAPVSTDAPATPTEQPSQPAPPQASAEPKEPFWYRKALKDQAQRQKELERRLQEAESRQPQAQPGPQLTPEQQFEQLSVQFNIRTSERFARKEHGPLFEEARDWLATRPDVEQWAQGQDDPWDAAINLYKREKMAAEIGDDPSAYRARLEAEIRAEYEQQQGQPTGQTMTAPRLPQSAATQRSAAPRGPIQKPSQFKHSW